LESKEIAERYLGMSGTTEASDAAGAALAAKLRGVMFAAE
jgi:hypothetical protein